MLIYFLLPQLCSKAIHTFIFTRSFQHASVSIVTADGGELYDVWNRDPSGATVWLRVKRIKLAVPQGGAGLLSVASQSEQRQPIN